MNDAPITALILWNDVVVTKDRALVNYQGRSTAERKNERKSKTQLVDHREHLALIHRVQVQKRDDAT